MFLTGPYLKICLSNSLTFPRQVFSLLKKLFSFYGRFESKILIFPLLLMVFMSITSCRRSQYEVFNLRMRRSASIRPLMSYGTVKFKEIHLDARDHLIILCLNNPSCLFLVRNTLHIDVQCSLISTFIFNTPFMLKLVCSMFWGYSLQKMKQIILFSNLFY